MPFRLLLFHPYQENVGENDDNDDENTAATTVQHIIQVDNSVFILVRVDHVYTRMMITNYHIRL